MRLSNEKNKKIEIPQDPDAGYIIIRALSIEELIKIESDSSTLTVADGKGQIVVVPYDRVNGIAKSCLKGWGNMFDAGGQELKFNNSNLESVKKCSVQVEGKMVRFFEWVEAEHAKFVEEVKVQVGEALEN